jgi:Bacterial AMP nucleoside phosphorylase N-terminus
MNDIYTTIAALKEQNRGKVFLTRENDKMHTLVIDTSAFLDPRIRPYHQEEEAVAQLQHLICSFITLLYSTTLNDYLEKFQAFLTAPDDYTENNKSRYHYPVFELYIRNTTIGGPHASRDAVLAYELRPYGYLTDPGTYEATITCPRLYETYLARQIRSLLKNHAPVIRVRPGICPMPIHFAIEAYGLGEVALEIPLPIEKIDVAVSNLIPLWFDVPKLSEIHDIAKVRSTESFKIPSLEFINDHYFQDNASSKAIFTEAITAHHREGSHKSVDLNDPFALDAPILHATLQKQISMKKEGMYEYKVHPLSLFNADRVDYSLGRIKHYTKTSSADFQNFVIFTNYQMYVDEFLKYCLSRLVLAA